MDGTRGNESWVNIAGRCHLSLAFYSILTSVDRDQQFSSRLTRSQGQWGLRGGCWNILRFLTGSGLPLHE